MLARMARNLSSRRVLPPAPTVIAGREDEKRTGDTPLDELNASIAACVEALPQVDVRQIQQLLQEHSKSVHIADVVCSLLLEGGAAARPVTAGPIQLEPRHRLRSPAYRRAVENLLLQEFSSLSKSTVRAVLAENNHSFTDARATLLALARKSWRAAISSWWNNRPALPPIPSACGGTGCAELDEELFGLHAPEREVAVSNDQKLAEELNTEQYDPLIECGCCFADVAWEQSAACTAGHLICRDCLVRGAQESNNGTVKCLSAATEERCIEPVCRSVLEVALPPPVLQAFEDRAARVNVKQCGLAVASCPFCPYAEFEATPRYHFHRGTLLILWVAFYVVLNETLPFNVAAVYVTVTAVLCAIGTPEGLQRTVALALGADAGARSMAARRRGTRFVCRNPACGLGSCAICTKAWPSMTAHNCVEDERDWLRLHVEQAMADAVKRVCPQCGCGFVKDGGCNKMTCPCGYKMCYRCRADLRAEGYEHFCDHFRPRGGACLMCSRCDLYGDPDDEVAARAAAEHARRSFIRMHGDPGRMVPLGKVVAGAELSSDLLSAISSVLHEARLWEFLIDLQGDGQ